MEKTFVKKLHGVSLFSLPQSLFISVLSLMLLACSGGGEGGGASPAPVIGAFTNISSHTRITGQTATLLPDGRALLAGGNNDGLASSNSGQLFDPVTNRITGTAILNTARQGHTATLMNNGKVLIAGGFTSSIGNFSRLSSSEIFDAATGIFTPADSMGSARAFHTATLLLDGNILIAGGTHDSGASRTVEKYDPITGHFTATGSMAVVRILHSATLLRDGKVLVAGGHDPNGDPSLNVYANAELYDPNTGTFITTGPMVTARTRHTATLLSDGKVLIAGGQDTRHAVAGMELYDPASGSFTPAGPMIWARTGHTATLLSNGRVLITGGNGHLAIDPPESGDFLLRTAEIRDPAIQTSIPTGSMTSVKIGHVAVLLGNGKVLIAGGIGAVPINFIEFYELFDPNALVH